MVTMMTIQGNYGLSFMVHISLANKNGINLKTEVLFADGAAAAAS